MTTELSNKSVEELRREVYITLQEGYHSDGVLKPVDELARRLEEAQQKNVAQQARIEELREAIESAEKTVEEEFNTELGDLTIAMTLTDDLSTLAAHDAKVAAEAKAEALEEAKALVLKRGEQICGAIDPKRTAIELGLKAAEYRAKATEAGRKE